MPWVGSWVPKTVIPSGSGIPADKEYAQAVYYGSTSCGYSYDNNVWYGYALSVCNSLMEGGSSSDAYQVVLAHPDCTGGYTGIKHIICYKWKDGVYADHDFDCDTLKDSVDTNSANPMVGAGDADNDGIDDIKDPEPNNANCPGTSANWRIQHVWVNRTNGCLVKYWVDSTGACKPFKTTTCSSVPESMTDLDPATWKTMLYIGGKSYAFNDIPVTDEVPMNGVYIDDPAQLVTGSGATTTYQTGVGTGGSSGTANYNSATSDDNKILGNYLEGIQKNTYDSVRNLKALSDQADKIIENQSAQTKAIRDLENMKTDMTGVESRLDTVITNTDDLPKMGTGSLPDGDVSAMQDNSDLSEEALTTQKTALETDFHNYLDGLIDASPITSIITGSGVSLSGIQTSIVIPWPGGDLTIDFTKFHDVLAILGPVFVGFCGLMGLITFLRR